MEIDERIKAKSARNWTQRYMGFEKTKITWLFYQYLEHLSNMPSVWKWGTEKCPTPHTRNRLKAHDYLDLIQRTVEIRTMAHNGLYDITRQVEVIVSERGIQTGLVNVYAQGATSVIMIQFNMKAPLLANVWERLKSRHSFLFASILMLWMMKVISTMIENSRYQAGFELRERIPRCLRRG